MAPQFNEYILDDVLCCGIVAQDEERRAVNIWRESVEHLGQGELVSGGQARR
jgi:hypothetical protein